jgi:hypothetical protein
MRVASNAGRTFLITAGKSARLITSPETARIKDIAVINFIGSH